MDRLFMLTGAKAHDPAVEEWLSGEPDALYSIARYWFTRFRQCGDDVTETLHDGCPVACVQGAAIGYVNVFSAHVNVGFFTGAWLPDPVGLLEGSGRRMRHVKRRPGESVDEAALAALIISAYEDVLQRLRSQARRD